MAREKKEKKKGSSLLANVDPNKSFMGLSVERLKHMDVESKFTFTFMRLLIIMGIAAVAMFVIIVMEFIGMRTMHAQYLKSVELAGTMKFETEATAANVLWALAAPDAETKKTRGDSAREHMGLADAAAAELADVFDNMDMLNALQSKSDAVHATGAPLLEMLQTASSEESYDYFLNTFYPDMQEFLNGVIEIQDHAITAADDMWVLARNISVALIVLAVIVAAIAIIFLIRAAIMLTVSVKTPVTIISGAADEMAKGNLSVEIEYESDDELGQMAGSMRHMANVLHGIVEDLQDVLSRLGSGDLVHGSRNPDCYIGDFLPVAQEIRKFRASLNGTMGNIKNASGQVGEGATNMNRGAQDLAEGATDQSASVQELTASVQTVVEQTKSLSESVGEGARVAREVKQSTDEGAEHMQHVVESMKKITDASAQIANISDTIAEIASQTNLLSLNASIEAARAGQSGKGFAVVADEIRKLASQSAEAAAQTKELIDGTIANVNEGNEVVEETNQALQKVMDGINQIQEIMDQNAEVAAQQSDAMNEIDKGIEQISQVVQANAASAEESSAISQELSEQSNALNELVAQFSISEEQE